MTLVATLTPADSTDVVTWSSSNEEIATVDATGKVTGVAEGTATITAKVSDTIKAECAVTVKAAEVLNYGTADTPLTIAEAKALLDQTGKGVVTKQPLYVKGVVSSSSYSTDYGNYTIWLQSDDGSVAKDFELYAALINSSLSGDYTASNALVGYEVVAYGFGELFNTTYELTRASDEPKNPLIISLTPPVPTEATGISLDKNTLALFAGDDYTLKATLSPAGAVGTVTWTSSNDAVATVDNNGKVTAVAEGTATITAKVSDTIKAECAVTVSAARTEATYNLIKCGSTNGYADSSDITFSDGKIWNIPGNQTLDYGLKIGGKLTSETDRALYSKSSYSEVFSIVVTHGTKDSAITVNSVKLYVYDSAEKAAAGVADNADEVVVGTFVDAGTTKFVPASGNSWQNKYFRLVYNMSSSAASSNKGVVLTELKLNFVAETPVVTNEALPWFTSGAGAQINRVEGAGIWTWIKYGDMGFDSYNEFNAIKSDIVFTYASTPTTTIRLETISDDNAGSKYCRVYFVLGAAYGTGVLTVTIPGKDGKTYEGTLEFASNALIKVNGVAIG